MMIPLSYNDFEKYLGDVLDKPFWHSENDSERRVLFKDAEETGRYPIEAYAKPGCYIFGVDRQLLYVGKTSATLWKRLRGRYFIGKNTQFVLGPVHTKAIFVI